MDTRTEAERRYDAERDGTLYTRPADDEMAIASEIDRIIAERRAQEGVWSAILDIMTDMDNDGRAYDHDKNIAVLERLEAAAGILPDMDAASGRMFDQETADALDIFTAWWQKARRDRD